MIRYSDLVKLNACDDGLDRFTKGRYVMTRLFDRPVSIHDIAYNSHCTPNDMMWLVRATGRRHPVPTVVVEAFASLLPELIADVDACWDSGIDMHGLRYCIDKFRSTGHIRWGIEMVTTLLWHSGRTLNPGIRLTCRHFMVNFFKSINGEVQ